MACKAPPHHDYTRYLKADALTGARIGIPRAFYYDEIVPPGTILALGGLNPYQRTLMNQAIEILRKLGATIIDPVQIPSVSSKDPDANVLLWNMCSGDQNARGKDQHCSIVLKYGMKRDFNKWLQSLGPEAPVKSLTELRQFNLAHQPAGAIKYGQSQLDISDEIDVDSDRARYEADRAKDIALGGTNGIDAALKENHLDALLFPGASGAAIAAKPGYPTVIVPFGLIPNDPTPPFPFGFDPKPAPLGVSFTGTACSEPRLIELAYAFEHATRRRVSPPSFP
jgi:amidase